MSEEKIVVRMAPSPTGNLHIGSVRTALFNFLFARHNNGKYILRIEDTDKERNKKEYEDDILEGFKWLRLNHDEFYRQSERIILNKDYLKKMIDSGVAYISNEEPKEENQRSEVIRFKNPNKKIQFNDLIRGVIEFDTTELSDFVIAKSIEEPLYHLAAVVDDHESGITHVIRGEEHLSNTSRQILIQEAIGAERPIYAHLPVIVDEARKKLSKREHGPVVWLNTYKEAGYLPEAILNYLALLGWNPGTEREIFTLKELINIFDFSKVHKSSAFFDKKKLEWVNKQHINLLSPEEKLKIIARDFDAETILEVDKEKICWKETSKEETLKHLEKAKKIIEEGGDLMAYAEREGKGNVLWPVRYALTGKESSPDPFTILDILGKEKSIKRLESAIIALKK